MLKIKELVSTLGEHKPGQFHEATLSLWHHQGLRPDRRSGTTSCRRWHWCGSGGSCLEAVFTEWISSHVTQTKSYHPYHPTEGTSPPGNRTQYKGKGYHNRRLGYVPLWVPSKHAYSKLPLWQGHLIGEMLWYKSVPYPSKPGLKSKSTLYPTPSLWGLILSPKFSCFDHGNPDFKGILGNDSSDPLRERCGNTTGETAYSTTRCKLHYMEHKRKGMFSNVVPRAGVPASPRPPESENQRDSTQELTFPTNTEVMLMVPECRLNPVLWRETFLAWWDDRGDTTTTAAADAYPAVPTNQILRSTICKYHLISSSQAACHICHLSHSMLNSLPNSMAAKDGAKIGTQPFCRYTHNFTSKSNTMNLYLEIPVQDWHKRLWEIPHQESI